MNFQGCLAAVNASGNGSETFEICSMAFHPNNHTQFVTIAHDGMIKLWNANTLQLIKSARIKSGYLTSLINYGDGFIVGTGNGELILFDNQLVRGWTKKIHFDCVNCIVQTQDYLVSAGSDGKICFLQKGSLSVEKQIDVGVPLTSLTKVGQHIFAAGNPSFKINLSNFQITEEKRSFQFLEFRGKVLGCSDEEGLFIVGSQDPIDHIGCHFMLEFQNRLVAVSQGSIGILNLTRSEEGDMQTSYRIYKAPTLKKGYSIKAGLVHEDCIILAGEQGYIYKFKFSTSEQKVA